MTIILYQAETKRVLLETNLSQNSKLFPLNPFDLKKVAQALEKDYPGVSLELLPEEDQLPADVEERTLFFERQLTRWNLFKMDEEIRAAKTAHILEAVAGLTAPLSKLQIVAGFVSLIALSSFYIFAKLAIDKRVLGISSIILRNIAYLVSTLSLSHVYISSVKYVRAKTRQDQLMQLSERERK